MRLTAIFAAAAIATMVIAPSTRAVAQAAYEQRSRAVQEANDAKFDFYVTGYRRCNEQVMATATARLVTAAATLRRLADDAKAGRNDLNPEDSERIARSVEEDLRQVRLLPFTTCEQTWQVRQAEEKGTPPPSGPRTVRGQHLLDAARIAARRCDKQRLEELRERLRQLANDAKNAIYAQGATLDAQDEARRDFANLQGLIIQANLLELKNCPKTQPATPPEPPLPPTPDPDDQSLGGRIARASLAHAAAAAKCDEVEMQRRLEELKQLEAEAKAQSKASKAVGEFAAVSPEQAAKDLKSASDELRKAAQRKPENCPKTEPPPPPPPPPSPKPTSGSQDCPVPGTPGGSAHGKTPPEHGMRFTPPDGNSQRMLAAHNRTRAEAGVPPLTWDRELAAGAAEYAAQMSTAGRVHAPRAGRKCVRENLLQSLRGGRSPEQMVGVWVSERVNFKPGIFPNVSTTGDWARVGHYTQVIWRATTHVGCAVRSDPRYDWTVCRYTPPGNQDGRPVL